MYRVKTFLSDTCQPNVYLFSAIFPTSSFCQKVLMDSPGDEFLRKNIQFQNQEKDKFVAAFV